MRDQVSCEHLKSTGRFRDASYVAGSDAVAAHRHFAFDAVSGEPVAFGVDHWLAFGEGLGEQHGCATRGGSSLGERDMPCAESSGGCCEREHHNPDHKRAHRLIIAAVSSGG